MSNRPLLICAFCLLLLPLLSRAEAPARTPVIVDTDIGDDTDDSWALVYALKSPGLDLKLVTTTFGKRQYRGALIAKFLTAAGRTDIPVGLGAPGDGDGKTRMQNWLGDFTVASYRGHIFDDGVQALVDTVNASPIPVTIIAIGPLNTIGAALQRDPGIAARANLVAMLGSIRVGYSNHPGQITEYNIWRDIPDAKRVLAAPWRSIAFTPLDTGNSPTIVGTRYATLLAKGDPLIQALLLQNALAYGAKAPAAINFGGSAFDDVAVFLAEGNPAQLAKMETLKIKVDDQGKTVIDPAGRPMSVATSWNNLDGFLDHMVETLLKK